jgi:hypothetical protein
LLDARLPAERVDAIVKETESHLLESMKNRLGSGVDDAEASRLAIEAYGQPDRIAAAFFAKSRRRVLGIDPRWWVAASSILAIWCWNMEWMSFRGAFDIFGDSWIWVAAGFAGVVALAAVANAVRAGLRSYRSWIAGISLGIVALSAPLMSFWMIPGTSEWQNISRLHLSRDTANVEQTITRIGAYGDYLNRGLAAYAVAKSASDLPLEFRDVVTAQTELHTQPAPGYYTPTGYVPFGGLPVPSRSGAMAMVDGRIWALNTAKEFDVARDEWLKNGPLALSHLPRQTSDWEVLLRNAHEAQSGRLFFPEPMLAKQVAIQTLEFLPVLLLVDWLAAASVTRRRRWAHKRLVVA